MVTYSKRNPVSPSTDTKSTGTSSIIKCYLHIFTFRTCSSTHFSSLDRMSWKSFHITVELSLLSFVLSSILWMFYYLFTHSQINRIFVFFILIINATVNIILYLYYIIPCTHSWLFLQRWWRRETAAAKDVHILNSFWYWYISIRR